LRPSPPAASSPPRPAPNRAGPGLHRRHPICQPCGPHTPAPAASLVAESTLAMQIFLPPVGSHYRLPATCTVNS
jgi:hypothetical protein